MLSFRLGPDALIEWTSEIDSYDFEWCTPVRSSGSGPREWISECDRLKPLATSVGLDDLFCSFPETRYLVTFAHFSALVSVR